MARTAGQELSVEVVFNDAQRSIDMHKDLSGQLWELLLDNKATAQQSLYTCISHVLVVSQKQACVDRIVSFMGEFSENAQLHLEGVGGILEHLLEWLATKLNCKDKAVRHRSCEILGKVMGAFENDIPMSEHLWNILEARLMDRLDDKSLNVRASAVSALFRLADPGEDQNYSKDRIVQKLQALAASDKSKEVREAAVNVLPGCDCTVRVVVAAATCDPAEKVRACALCLLGDEEEFKCSHLSIAQRVAVLTSGLQDASRWVRSNAVELAAGWLERHSNGRLVHLLQSLDVQHHEVAAEQVVLALFDAGKVDERQAVEELTAMPWADWQLRGSCAVLSPEEAMLLKLVCCHMHEQAASRSVAASRSGGALATVRGEACAETLDLLNSLLPSAGAVLLEAARQHCAAGSCEAYFAARQLLATASCCLDFADADTRSAGRRLLADLLQQMQAGSEADAAPFASAGGDGRWERSVLQLAAAVHDDGASLAEDVLSAVLAMCRAAGLREWADPAAAHPASARFAPSALPGAVPPGGPSWAQHSATSAPLHAQALHLLSQLLLTLPSLHPLHVAMRKLRLPMSGLYEGLLLPGLSCSSTLVRRRATELAGQLLVGQALSARLSLRSLPSCRSEELPEAAALLAAVLKAVAAGTEPATTPVRIAAVRALADAAVLAPIDELQLQLGGDAENGVQGGIASAHELRIRAILLTVVNEAADAAEARRPGRKGSKKKAAPAPEQDEAADLHQLLLAAVEAAGKMLLLATEPDCDPQREDCESVALIARLLSLFFSPRCPADAAQRLRILLPHIAVRSGLSRSCLAAAMLPAARRSLAAAATPYRSSAGPLLRYAAQLLTWRSDNEPQLPGEESDAEPSSEALDAAHADADMGETAAESEAADACGKDGAAACHGPGTDDGFQAAYWTLAKQLLGELLSCPAGVSAKRYAAAVLHLLATLIHALVPAGAHSDAAGSHPQQQEAAEVLALLKHAAGASGAPRELGKELVQLVGHVEGSLGSHATALPDREARGVVARAIATVTEHPLLLRCPWWDSHAAGNASAAEPIPAGAKAAGEKTLGPQSARRATAQGVHSATAAAAQSDGAENYASASDTEPEAKTGLPLHKGAHDPPCSNDSASDRTAVLPKRGRSRRPSSPCSSSVSEQRQALQALSLQP